MARSRIGGTTRADRNPKQSRLNVPGGNPGGGGSTDKGGGGRGGFRSPNAGVGR